MLTAEEQKALVEEAGFIDVQVFQKWIDLGTFTNGTRCLLKRRANARSDFQTGRSASTVCSCLGLPHSGPAIHLDSKRGTAGLLGKGDRGGLQWK
jgi:hypothetical protein